MLWKFLKIRGVVSFFSLFFFLCVGFFSSVLEAGALTQKGPNLSTVSKQQPVHALSIRGAPKYDANFTHFAPFNPKAPKGGTIRIAVVGTFNTLNSFVPGGMCAKGLGIYAYYPFDPLMERSPDEPFALYPRLAQFVYLAPGRDTMTFYLNPKARFQSGESVRAKDVVFTFNLFKKHGSPARKMLCQKIKEVRAEGELAVTFVFHPGPDGSYDQELPLIIAGMPILSEKALRGKDFSQTGLTPLMGSGPYRVAEVNPGQMIRFEKDPHYWGRDLPSLQGLYHFDEIVFEYFGSETAAFEAFKKGIVNYWTETNPGRWAHEYTFPAVTNGEILKEQFLFSNASLVTTLIFNTHRGPLKDPLVRQALGSLFDFEWINAKLFHQTLHGTSSFFGSTPFAAKGAPDAGEVAILKSLPDVPEAVWGDLPAWPATDGSGNMRPQIRHAHTLLQKAGWSFDPSRHVWTKKGESLSFELLLQDPQNEKVALAYKRVLDKAGVQLLIRTVDTAQYQKRVDTREFDLMLFTFGTTLSPGAEQKLYWLSEFSKGPSRNYAGIESKAIDRVCDLLTRATTQEEVITIMRVLDRLLRHGCYMRPLYNKRASFVAYWAGLAHPASDGKIILPFESWWWDPLKSTSNVPSKEP